MLDIENIEDLNKSYIKISNKELLEIYLKTVGFVKLSYKNDLDIYEKDFSGMYFKSIDRELMNGTSINCQISLQDETINFEIDSPNMFVSNIKRTIPEHYFLDDVRTNDGIGLFYFIEECISAILSTFDLEIREKLIKAINVQE